MVESTFVSETSSSVKLGAFIVFSYFFLQTIGSDYDPLPNVGGLILGANQAEQWIDLAVDPVYKVSDVLNQTVVAYIYYVPNEYGGSFDGACDVTGVSETATITTSPLDYTANTTWAVVRIPMCSPSNFFFCRF